MKKFRVWIRFYTKKRAILISRINSLSEKKATLTVAFFVSNGL
jgi:hypothetical protein